MAKKKSKKPQYARGGKLGSKIGDSFKFAGDTLLSTIGLSDVIGDENYRNQGFADASRVGEQIGKGVGQVAGNLILPGMGGNIVKTGQNLLGNVDGEDQERARIEQMRANKDSYGKYSDSITDMNKAVNPLVAGTQAATGLANMAAGNFAQTGNVLGDLSGLKNSFGQGILGQAAPATGDMMGAAIGALKGQPNNQINYEFATDMQKINNPAAGTMGIQAALNQSQGDIMTNYQQPISTVQNQVPFNFNAFAYGGNMKTKYQTGGPISLSPEITEGSPEHQEYLRRLSNFQSQDPTEFQKYQDIYGADNITPTGGSVVDFFTNEWSDRKKVWDTTSELNRRGMANPYDYKNVDEYYSTQYGTGEAGFTLPRGAAMYSAPHQDISNEVDAKIGKHMYRGVGDKDHDYFWQYTDPSGDYDVTPAEENMQVYPEDTRLDATTGIKEFQSGNYKTRNLGDIYVQSPGGETVDGMDFLSPENYNPNAFEFVPNQDFKPNRDWIQPKYMGEGKDRVNIFEHPSVPTTSNSNVNPLPTTPMQTIPNAPSMSPSDFKGRHIYGALDQGTIRDISNKTSFAYGGNVEEMPDGGKFVQYDGPTHGQGGIDIDQNGMPTVNPNAQAEVEGQETMHDNGIEKYMFSARLIPQSELDKKNDKKKHNVKTYADLSKEIHKRYPEADKDPIQLKSRNMELERLKAEQEADRSMLNGIEQGNGQQQSQLPDMFQYGGTYGGRDNENIGTYKQGYSKVFDRQDVAYDNTHREDTMPSESWILEADDRQHGWDLYPIQNNAYMPEKFGFNKNLMMKYYKGELNAKPRFGADGKPIKKADGGRLEGNVTRDRTGSSTFRDSTGKVHFQLGGELTKKQPVQEDPFILDQQSLQFMQPIHEDPFVLGGLPQDLLALSGALGTTTDDITKFDKEKKDQVSVLQHKAQSENWNPYKDVARDLINMSGENTPNTADSGSQLPQERINPMGLAASMIGPAYDLFQAGQETPANDFGRVNPKTIDLSKQRTELEKQAGLSRAIARENARNAPSAGGAMTNRVISNAIINSQLGSGLSQSYQTEEAQNVQILNQAEFANHQTRIQEKLADQQDLALRKSTISQAMHNIGMNLQGYTRDLESARVGNLNNKLWFDAVKNGKYFDMKWDESTQSMIMIPKVKADGSKNDDQSEVHINTQGKTSVVTKDNTSQ